ncbi:MAG: MgtC/SapB family protein [Actinomycetota bacterium]|jgi:putative Mg2+ transporter-C (MgtC) family protein|nr:MgtC/SapB family protein [Actinomycetota bacterium]MDQ3529347.1 MgtC/SapB family protein [Actinomycetota bacterium]
MDLEPLWRVLVAAALSIPVGLDRELRGKSAGLRTHAVVAAASAALGYLSVATATSQGEDATRIASQVVTGIGFMGAGVIFASQGRVHGLTTAAALWSAMATGLCVGMGATGPGASAGGGHPAVARPGELGVGRHGLALGHP